MKGHAENMTQCAPEAGCVIKGRVLDLSKYIPWCPESNYIPCQHMIYFPVEKYTSVLPIVHKFPYVVS